MFYFILYGRDNSWAGFRNVLKKKTTASPHNLSLSLSLALALPFKRNDEGTKTHIVGGAGGEAMNNRATNPVKCGLWEIQLPIQWGRRRRNRHW